MCVSDHKTHDTIMVYSFLKHFYKHYITNKFPFLHRLYFSDGSVAQYKNFKILTNLIFHQIDLHIQAEWNFFCHIAWKECLQHSWWHYQKSQLYMQIFSTLFQTKSSPQSSYLIFLKPMLMVSPHFFWAPRRLLVTISSYSCDLLHQAHLKEHRITSNSFPMLQA